MDISPCRFDFLLKSRTCRSPAPFPLAHGLDQQTLFQHDQYDAASCYTRDRRGHAHTGEGYVLLLRSECCTTHPLHTHPCGGCHASWYPLRESRRGTRSPPCHCQRTSSGLFVPRTLPHPLWPAHRVCSSCLASMNPTPSAPTTAVEQRVRPFCSAIASRSVRGTTPLVTVSKVRL